VQGKAGVMTVCVWPVKSGAVVVIVDPSVQCVFDAPVPKRSGSVVQVSATAEPLIEAVATKIIKSFLMSSRPALRPVTIGMVTHASLPKNFKSIGSPIEPKGNQREHGKKN
jgi:hypothetical protein